MASLRESQLIERVAAGAEGSRSEESTKNTTIGGSNSEDGCKFASRPSVKPLRPPVSVVNAMTTPTVMPGINLQLLPTTSRTAS